MLRVLRQKLELGLLDATFDDDPPSGVDLDSPEHRRLARRLAEESIVLLSNDGTLPMPPGRRIAVIGPNADRPGALFGCYSFLNHVLPHHPGVETGIEVRDRARRDPRGVRRRCGRVGARLRVWMMTTEPVSAKPSPPRPKPTSPFSSWATMPECSGAELSARGAIGTTLSCLAFSAT